MSDTREKHEYIARLNKALKIRASIERASALRTDDYGPDRMLAAAQQWGDPQWAIVCQWAVVPEASELTRALVLRLLRERAASSARCAEAGGHYRDNQDLCHACGVGAAS
jgi:hypothetical protein